MTTLDVGKSFFTVCRDGKGELCGKPAICRLRAPDGQLVPGSFHCIEHAAEIVREYAVKLGETWTAVDAKGCEVELPPPPESKPKMPPGVFVHFLFREP